MYELATSTHLKYDKTGKVPFLKGVERIINAGFKNLDYNFLDMVDYPNRFLDDDYKDWMYECREFVEAHGAKWVQAHSAVTGARKNFEKFMSMQKRSIECCSYLGIEWTVHHHIEDPEYSAHSSLSPMDFNLKMFDELLETAEKYKVGIAVENSPSRFFADSTYEESTEDLVKLVDKLGSKYVGICWDVGHGNVHHVHKNADNITHQSEQLKLIGNRLKATHIQDNNASRAGKSAGLKVDDSEINTTVAFDEHIQPYMGTVDWMDVIKGLDAINYNHYFSFEVHNAINSLPDELTDSALVHLRRIGEYLVSKSTLTKE